MSQQEIANRLARLQQVGSQRDSGATPAASTPDQTIQQRLQRLQEWEKGQTATEGAIERRDASIDYAEQFGKSIYSNIFSPPPSLQRQPPTPATGATATSATGTVTAPAPVQINPDTDYVQPQGLAPFGTTGPSFGQKVEQLLLSGPYQELFKKIAPDRITSVILNGIGQTLDMPVTGVMQGMKGVQETLARSADMYGKGDILAGSLYNVAAPVHGAFAGLMNLSGGGLMFQAGQKMVETAIPESKPFIEKGLAPFSTIVSEREAAGDSIPEAVRAAAGLLDAAWGIFAFKKAHELAKINYDSYRAGRGIEVDPEAKYRRDPATVMTPQELELRQKMGVVDEAVDLQNTLRDEATAKPRQEQTAAPTGSLSSRREGVAPLTGEERDTMINTEVGELAKIRDAMAQNPETPQGAAAVTKTMELLQRDPEAYARESLASTQRALESPMTSADQKPLLQQRIDRWQRFLAKEQPAAAPAVEGMIPKDELDALMAEQPDVRRRVAEAAKAPEAPAPTPPVETAAAPAKPAPTVTETAAPPAPPKKSRVRKAKATQASVPPKDPVTESREAPPATPAPVKETPKRMSIKEREASDAPLLRRYVADKIGTEEGMLEGLTARELVEQTGKPVTILADEIGPTMDLPEALATWSERGRTNTTGSSTETQFVKDVVASFLRSKADAFKAAGREDLLMRENTILTDAQTTEALDVLRAREKGVEPAPKTEAAPTPAPAPTSASTPKPKKVRKLREEQRLDVAAKTETSDATSEVGWNPYQRKGTVASYKSEAQAKNAANALMRNKSDIEARPVNRDGKWQVEVRERNGAAEPAPATAALDEIVSNSPKAQEVVGGLDDLFGLGEVAEPTSPRSGEFNYSPPPQGGYDPRIFPKVRAQLQQLWAEFEGSGKTFEQFHDAVMEKYNGKGVDIMRYMRESFPDKLTPEVTKEMQAVIEQRTAAAKKGMKDAGVDDATAAAVESGAKPDGTPVTAADIDRAGQRIAREQGTADDTVKRRDLLQKAKSSPERARLRDQLVESKFGTADDIDAGLALWDFRAVRWAEMTGETPEAWWTTRGVEARAAGEAKIQNQVVAAREGSTALEFRKNGEIVLTALKAPNFNAFLGSSFQLFFGDMAMTLRDLNIKINGMESGSEGRLKLEGTRNQLMADINQLEQATGLRRGEFNDLFRRVQADVPTQQDAIRFHDAMQKMADIGDNYFSGDTGKSYVTKEMQPLLTRFHDWMVGFWSSAKAAMRGASISDPTREALKRWFWDKPSQYVKPSLGQKASPRDYVGIGSNLAQWMQMEMVPLVSRMRNSVGKAMLDDPQVLMTTIVQVLRSSTDPTGIRFTTLREAKEYVSTVIQRQAIAARLKGMGIEIGDEYAGLDPAERESARAMDDKISKYMDGIRRRFYGISEDSRSVPSRLNVQKLLADAQHTSAERLLQQSVTAIRTELEDVLTKIEELEKPRQEAKAESEAAYTEAQKRMAAGENATIQTSELSEAQLRRRGIRENIEGLKERAEELDDLYRFLAGRVEYGKEQVSLGTEAEPLDAEVVKALHQSPRSAGHIAFMGDKEFFYNPATKAIEVADITSEIGDSMRRTGKIHEKWSKEAVENVKRMARTNPRANMESQSIPQKFVTIEEAADPQSYKDAFINEIKLDLAALDIFGNRASLLGWRETKRVLDSVRNGHSTAFQTWRTDSGAEVTLPVLVQSIELAQQMNKSDNQIHRALIRNFFPDLHPRQNTDPVQRPLPDISVGGMESLTGKRYKTETIEVQVRPVSADVIPFRAKLKVGQTVFYVDAKTGKTYETKADKIRIGDGGKKLVTVDLGASGGGVKEVSAANLFETEAQRGTEKRTIRREMTDEEVIAEMRHGELGTGEGVPSQRAFIRTAAAENMPVERTSPKEVPIEHVVNHLQRVFGVPINTKGKLFAWARDVFGIFRTGPQSIWTREYGDLDAIGHELGHWVSKKFFTGGLTQMSALLQQELGRLDYDPAKARVEEGFAEYFRALMTNRDAQSMAPNFHHFFMNTILGNDARLKNAITTGRQKVWDYQSMTAVAKVGSLMDDIGGGKLSDASWKDRVGAFASNTAMEFRSKWTNSLDPLRVWVAEITAAGSPQGVQLSPSKDPYQVAMAFSKSAPAIARYMVERGIYNAQGDLMCESLREIIKILPDEAAVQNGLKLAYVLRAEELMNRVDAKGDPAPVDVGLTFQEIQDVKNTFSDPSYRQFVDGLHRWNHAVLEYLVDAGGLDRAEGEIIRNANLMYIPLKVAFDGHWDVHVGRFTGLQKLAGIKESGAARGIADIGKPFRHITGSRMGKVNPIEAMVLQTERIVSLANRARVSRAMVELAENVEGIAPWIEKVQPLKANSVRISQMKGELQKAGINLPAASLDKIVTLFSNADHYYGAEDVVSLVRDGKREFYKIDPYLYKSLQSMTVKQWSPMLNWLTMPARFVRVGTTGYNAAFNLITNPIRDLQTAALQSSPNPDARNIAKAMAQIWGDAARETLHLGRNADVATAREMWKATGGEMSQPLGGEIFGESNVKRMVDDALLEGKIGKKLAMIATHPADAMVRLIDSYKRAISIPESIPREAEFLRTMDGYRQRIELAEQQGNMDLAWRLKEDMMIDATNKAADITVNFRRAGTYAEIINRIVPFFNPSIQGTTRAYRLFRENPAAAMMRASVLVGASAAIWALNRDKDWYKALPAWERYGFWHFEGFGGEIIRLPMPFEWGYIFAGIPQAALHDQYMGNNEEKKEIATQLAKQLLPIDVAPITTDWITGKTDFGSSVVNQGINLLGDVAAIRPIVEIGFNRDIFRDRPIIPKEVEDVQKWLQYTSTTPEIARKFSNLSVWGKSGLSPIVVEHLASGYTGGLAREMMKSATAFGAVKATMPSEPSDIPILGRLFVRHNIQGFGSKDVQTFYRNFDRATMYKKTIDNMIPPRGNRPVKNEEIVLAVEQGRLDKEAIWMYKAYPAFTATRNFLQIARQRENALRNLDWDDDTKQKVSKALAEAIMVRIKAANAGFDEYMKSME